MTPRIRSLLTLVMLALFGVTAHMIRLSTPPPRESTGAASELTDAVMFRHVVERVKRGEPYYASMQAELHAGNYPTASVFNWRTPLLYLVLATLPGWGSLALMGVLGLLVLGLLATYFSRHVSPEGTVVGLILSAAAAVTLIDAQGLWMTEAWAGLLMGLSLAAYFRSAWIPAAVAGLAALFLRELAAPFCVVCVLLAVKERRHRELGVWVAGLVLFASYYWLHVTHVLAHIGPDDAGHPESWIQFGGLGFWLATLQINKAIFAGPRWILTVASTLLVAGLTARSLPSQVRLTVITYSAFFGIAGQSFNAYWGFLVAFANAIAIAHGPAVLEWNLRQARASVPLTKAA